MNYSGGCLCGAVRFEVEGDFEHFFLCHCARCRKGSGSSNAANLFARSAALRWLSGESMVAVYELPGSRHGRAFCKACGSPLPTSQDGGSLLVVPAGSLETDLAMRPQGHLFMASRASWDDRLDEVPRFDALPD